MEVDNGFKISIQPTTISNINISDPSSIKQLFDNMKKDLSLIISYIDLATKQCTEKNLQINSQDKEISSLTTLAKKYNQESIHFDSKLREYHDLISLTEHDVIKFKSALDGVVEITSDLPASDIDQIKKMLEDSFMKKTHDLEKIIEELKLFKKTQDAHDSKMLNLQNSLTKLEFDFDEQTTSVNSFCSTVEKTTLHIAQTYFNVMAKSNDMLQTVIGVKQKNNANLDVMSDPDHNKEKLLSSEIMHSKEKEQKQPLI